MELSARTKRTLSRALIPYWRRREPPVLPARTFTMNPADNIQISMNLVMPLKDPSAFGRAMLIQTLAPALEAVTVGLNTTGLVHFARFSIVQGSLCMFSIYDGDFSNYIRDFIANIGDVFDALMAFVKDPPPTPVADNVQEFIDWVMARDAMQMPDAPTDLAENLHVLPRRLMLLLDASPNVQLFAYRAYPGYSTAQVRNSLQIGW